MSKWFTAGERVAQVHARVASFRSRSKVVERHRLRRPAAQMDADQLDPATDALFPAGHAQQSKLLALAVGLLHANDAMSAMPPRHSEREATTSAELVQAATTLLLAEKADVQSLCRECLFRQREEVAVEGIAAIEAEVA